MYLDLSPSFTLDHARRLPSLFLLVLVVGLAGCERALWDPTLKVGAPGSHILDNAQSKQAEPRTLPAETIAIGEPEQPPKRAEILQRGSGAFVRKVSPTKVDTAPGDITLNFDGTDIREVVKVILGDLLRANYVLHPAVQGAVSLQTGRPLRLEDLLPTLETLLRMNNAALVYKDRRYEVVPLANAVQGQVTPQLGNSDRPLPSGYSVQVVPLRYVGAEEMSNILKPLAPEGSIIRVDNLRNLLVIAGTGSEMANLLETIRAFDVDWMAGLSVGLFPLEYAKTKDVAAQLESLLAEEGNNPLKGIFHFIPIESANALLVVSPQARYLEQVQTWIERLDLAEARNDSSERVYVYRVRHSDAESLADTLSQLFGGTGSKRKSTVGNIAPGLGKATSSTTGTTSKGTTTTSSDDSTQNQTRQGATAHEIELSSTVNIVADSINNSLLIRATPRDYQKILDALKQLDILPLQVLVEATIVEVTLAGNLKYGLQWELFGPGKEGKSFASFDGTLDDAKASGIKTMFPGFNWALVSDPNTIKATLSALAGQNLLKVLSSPSVMVMDNQTAKIQVGQEVPIATSQQEGFSTTDRTYTTISYKDTGVILKVKPRVTPAGLVQMQIEQEVSTVLDQSASALNSPSFKKRTITSSVAVRSNQAVVLGGLIEDSQSDGKQGVPGFHSLPVVGALFGESSKSASRTELLVVLTPKVIANDQDIESVTEDFRKKLQGLKTGL
ncbi:type II secretion system secretin GspD [Caldichromatium japonicum]|uniref:Type II secretion system secretin GspD n=1 Tax=Caldichromatium japonicum TaxID=2699430 RepID=A0A6G7VA62_9GAMM|nr:type II secretion system secretin GspD [Caldichromatium japonicum]QIK36677.1 type II secretion system secretin GspD [Caldichromatium japonicum]